jgi:nucleotide-binding universal stress UspA family protein
MALKNLLVHVNSEAVSGPAVDAALVLAEAHDAHLVGLGIRAPADIPTYAEARLPESVVEILNERESNRLASARALFEARAKHAGREGRAEWRDAQGLPWTTFNLHARYSDLGILSQNQPDASDRRFIDLAEEVLVSAGRPIVIVPSSGAGKTIGAKVVVAWNGSRESARALGDAMPVLEKAKSVEVFIAGDQNLGDLPGADIAAHLAHHRIHVDIHRSTAAEVSVGDALLNRVADSSADLLVMGGYGRSRFSEFILGGVTRYILQHMTVPVFMSH